MDDNHERLNDILETLAKEPIGEEKYSSYIDQLNDIYTGEFRHLYSVIFAIITRIDGYKNLSLETLAENMKSIYSASQKSNHINNSCKRSLMKLYDHVNLEIARVNYTKKISDDISEKNTITNNELRTLKLNAEKMQKEYITILGIFSSIVLTFVAGIVFSSAVLSNIDKVSIYHLIFVMLMIGLVIFNLVNFLLSFIRELNHSNTTDNSMINIINLTICVSLIIDIISWHCFG